MGWPGPATERQFAAWQEWLAEEDKRPSRVEQVLVGIAEAKWGITFEWKSAASEEVPAVPTESGKSDVGRMMPVIGSILGDITKIKGGDRLAARLEQLRQRGEI